MTKSWRPEGWDNPHKDDGLDSCPDCSAVFEAGADAMMEVLIKYVIVSNQAAGTKAIILDAKEFRKEFELR